MRLILITQTLFSSAPDSVIRLDTHSHTRDGEAPAVLVKAAVR